MKRADFSRTENSDPSHQAFLTWNPLYFMTTFNDKSMSECLGLHVTLPAGTLQADQELNHVFKMEVIDDGMTLSLKVKWPDLAADMEKLLDNLVFDKDDDYYNMKSAYNFAWGKFQGKDDEDIVSVAKIPLPWKAQAKIEPRDVDVVQSRSGAKIVFIILRAPTVGFKVLKHKKARWVD